MNTLDSAVSSAATKLAADAAASAQAAAAPSHVSPASSLDAEPRLSHIAGTGFGVGAALGGFVGAAAIGLASLGTEVVLPGHWIHATGPLLAMLFGAGAGAANGGLVGALIGWGIPVEILPEEKAGDTTVASSPTDKARGFSVKSVLCPNC